MRHVIRAIVMVAIGLAATAPAADFEQTLNQTVHTVFGVSGTTGVLFKAGNPYDGGIGGALLGWPGETFGGSITNAALELGSLDAADAGGFTVHQMITPWDESTAWGMSLPVEGVDYNPHPVGHYGHNAGSGAVNSRDTTEISHLVSYWASGGTNNGLFLKPLGVTNNPNYPGSPLSNGVQEFQFANRLRVPTGPPDGDDQEIKTDIGTHAFLPDYIEPISDAVINQAAPDATHSKHQGLLGSGVEGGNLKIPLLQWGLGEITAAAPTFATTTTVGGATLKVQSGNTNTTDFNVHRMLAAWDESSVTWNQFTGGNGPQSGADYDALSLGLISVDSSNAATELDITSTFNFWLANPSLNHGIVLVPVIQTGTQETTIIDSRRTIGLDGGAPGDDTWIHVTDVFVPEPSSLALGALGLLCLAKRRRHA